MQENHQITLNLSREEYEVFLKYFREVVFPLIDNTCSPTNVKLSSRKAEIFNDIVRMILKPGE